MKKEDLIESTNQILENIIVFLFKIKIDFNEEIKSEYISFIEQDMEKLLQFNNYGIIDLNIFQKIKQCYLVVLKYKEDSDFFEKNKKYKIIIEELCQNFRYILEGILFMIENIC
jgi:hypothetical protein